MSEFNIQYDSARHNEMMNFQIPSQGYYWFIGAEDARNNLGPRVLGSDLAQYQDSYDGGFAQGQWNDLYLNRDTI